MRDDTKPTKAPKRHRSKARVYTAHLTLAVAPETLEALRAQALLEGRSASSVARSWLSAGQPVAGVEGVQG